VRERPPRRPRLLSREEAHLWGEIAKLITPLRGRARPRKPQTAPAEAERSAAPAPPVPAPPTARPAAKGASKAIAKPAAKPAAKSVARAPAKPAAPPPARPGPAMPLPRPATKPLKLGDLAPEIARATARATAAPVQVAAPPPPGAPGLERRERRGLERGTLSIDARIDLHGLYQAEAHAALVGFLLRARAAGHARVLVVTGKGGESFGGQDRGGFAERGVLRRSVPHWLRGPELRGLVIGFEEAARHHGGAGALYVRLRRR